MNLFNRTLGFAVLSVALFGRPAGSSEDLQWNIVNRVVSGSGVPSITLTSARALTDARLHLVRNDGAARELRFGSIPAGGSGQVTLNTGEGRFLYEGTLRVTRERETPTEFPVKFDIIVAPPLTLEVPGERLDLGEGRLEVRLDREAERCTYGVHKEGQPPLVGVEEFGSAPAGQWLPIEWGPSSEQEVVLKISLECFDVDGFSNGLELSPWRFEVPHEDVTFALGSDEIPPAQAPRVEAAVGQIQRTERRYGSILKVRLFISGHTDTVGDPAVNRRLSERRAAAIGRAFRAAGVRIPISYFGYGETRQAVSTLDEIPEARNRRVRYILAVQPPEGVSWRPLK